MPPAAPCSRSSTGAARFRYAPDTRGRAARSSLHAARVRRASVEASPTASRPGRPASSADTECPCRSPQRQRRHPR
ncbi:MAG: hypothetical protein DI537_34660 [Stutzerimonas stutzeri]|nr:MAG: hypothetical protein DI537_34660 [Stutzerimonas stutzeri]